MTAKIISFADHSKEGKSPERFANHSEMPAPAILWCMLYITANFAYLQAARRKTADNAVDTDHFLEACASVWQHAQVEVGNRAVEEDVHLAIKLAFKAHDELFRILFPTES